MEVTHCAAAEIEKTSRSKTSAFCTARSAAEVVKTNLVTTSARSAAEVVKTSRPATSAAAAAEVTKTCLCATSVSAASRRGKVFSRRSLWLYVAATKAYS